MFEIKTQFTTEQECINYADNEGLNIIMMTRHGEDGYFNLVVTD
jgi:hypothetical protein